MLCYTGIASRRDPSTRHLDGQNLKVAFLDGQLFVMDGIARRAVHNRPCRIFCASLPVRAILQCNLNCQKVSYRQCINHVLSGCGKLVLVTYCII